MSKYSNFTIGEMFDELENKTYGESWDILEQCNDTIVESVAKNCPHANAKAAAEAMQSSANSTPAPVSAPTPAPAPQATEPQKTIGLAPLAILAVIIIAVLAFSVPNIISSIGESGGNSTAEANTPATNTASESSNAQHTNPLSPIVGFERPDDDLSGSAQESEPTSYLTHGTIRAIHGVELRPPEREFEAVAGFFNGSITLDGLSSEFTSRITDNDGLGMHVLSFNATTPCDALNIFFRNHEMEPLASLETIGGFWVLDPEHEQFPSALSLFPRSQSTAFFLPHMLARNYIEADDLERADVIVLNEDGLHRGVLVRVERTYTGNIRMTTSFETGN